MLGRCVTGQGSNDDVSNFPEVNVNSPPTWIYSLSSRERPFLVFEKFQFQLLWHFSTWLDVHSRNAHKSTNFPVFALSRSTPNGPITIWSVPSRSAPSSTCRPTVAMDYFSPKSSRPSPASKYLIWSRNQRRSSKWWVNPKRSALTMQSIPINSRLIKRSYQSDDEMHRLSNSLSLISNAIN